VVSPGSVEYPAVAGGAYTAAYPSGGDHGWRGLGSGLFATASAQGARRQRSSRPHGYDVNAVNEEVKAYYAGFAEREWARLENPADGQVEFAVTCDVLARHLPVGARVLDVGGGPGRYAIWLAEHEYRVTLADVSSELLAIARERIDAAGVEVQSIVEADARDLAAWADASFDAVVCLGPFYHLTQTIDRERAASEVGRVLVQGGVAFIALMPALGFVRRTLAVPDERRHLLDAGFLERVMGDGVFVNDVPGRFTQGYGVRLEEVEPFFARFGFEQLALLSAESLTIGLESELPSLLGDAVLARLVHQLAISHASDPGILGLARHLLYVGRRRAGTPTRTS
jgi:ubiquinone/menaquinone biosynthesis C-methylase UbiE